MLDIPIVDSIALILFVLGVLHAIYRAVYQMRERRKLGERELRWRQSEQARSIMNDLEDDEYAAAAMLMLDYSGREVVIGGKMYRFSWSEIDLALRVENLDDIKDREVVIRDCYDHLFYHLERVALWIEVELISIYDIVFPLGYVVKCMSRRKEVFEKFLAKFDYSRTLALLHHFKEYGGRLTANSSAPRPRKPTFGQTVGEFLGIFEPPGKLELAGSPSPDTEKAS